MGRATAVERTERYYKACGEAVPVEAPLISKEHVVDKVRRYRFFSGERLVGEVSYTKPRWYIIDKGAWVESLRSALKPDEKDDGVVVDARGPYSSAGAKAIVVMVYVEGIRREDKTADFIYPPGRTGLFWVFPHGGLYNVGGGLPRSRRPDAYGQRVRREVGR